MSKQFLHHDLDLGGFFLHNIAAGNSSNDAVNFGQFPGLFPLGSANNLVAISSGGGSFTYLTLGSGLSIVGGVITSTAGSPGGSNTDVQYNSSGVFGGDDSVRRTATGQFTFAQTGLGTTATDALIIQNSTAATSLAPVQYSPAIDLIGHVWNTSGTPADNYVRWRFDTRPVSSSSPTNVLHIRSSIDTGTNSFSDAATLDNIGNLTLSQSLYAVGANFSALTASLLVGTDSSKNLTSLSYATVAGNLTVGGDLSGTVNNATIAKLDGVTLPAPSGTNKALVYNGTTLSWGTLGAGGSNTQGQFNSSGSLAGDAGWTYGGQGGSVLHTFTPTSTSATALQVSCPASWAGKVLNAIDSSSNTLFLMSNSTTQSVFRVLSPSSSTTQGTIMTGLNTYQSSSGAGFGAISFGESISGSYTGLATILAGSAEVHDSTHGGTTISFWNTPAGIPTRTQRQIMAITSGGSFVPNLSGSAISTSATDAFVYLTAGAGPPVGSPIGYTGSQPTYYDTNNNVLWLNSSVWRPIGNKNPVSSPTTNLVMTYPTDVFLGSAANGIDITFPAAGTWTGAKIITKWIALGTFTVTLSDASSANLEGSATYTFTSNSTNYYSLIWESNGANWWIVAYNIGKVI